MSDVREFDGRWSMGQLRERFDVHATILLANEAGRHPGVVLEKDDVVALDRLLQEGPLELERLHRIEVVAHYPREIDVRRRRHQVGGEDRGLPAGLDEDD